MKSVQQLTNPVLTCIKYIINRFIIRPIFKVDPWHDYPFNHKSYAVDMVHFINNDKNIIDWDNILSKDSYIVEVGCGRGDIIGRIKRTCKGKTGYDLEKQILKVGGVFHRNINMVNGSFVDVTEKDISIFIMVNFIQSISPEELKHNLDVIQKQSNIKLIVFDTLKMQKDSPYQFSHDGNYLLPNYKKIYQSKKYATKFKAERQIEYWVKK